MKRTVNTAYLVALDFNEVYSTYSNQGIDESILSIKEHFEANIIRATETQVILENNEGNIVLIPIEWILWMAPKLPPEAKEEATNNG